MIKVKGKRISGQRVLTKDEAVLALFETAFGQPAHLDGLHRWCNTVPEEEDPMEFRAAITSYRSTCRFRVHFHHPWWCIPNLYVSFFPKARKWRGLSAAEMARQSIIPVSARGYYRRSMERLEEHAGPVWRR